MALATCALLATGTALAAYEWRDVVQDVTIEADGSVVVVDERTLWTDGDFGEAFLCVQLTGTQTLTLLEGSGAVSAGPPATAYQQPCAGGTEVVVRQEARVRERRVRFVYRLDGVLDAYRDVVQWYWQVLERDRPVVLGYRVTVRAPGPMAEPFDAFVHRFANPEVPRVELSLDRRVLTVAFERVPTGDGVEVRYLMDPALFSLAGPEDGLARLLQDEMRVVAFQRLETALQYAAEHESVDTVAALLAQGADPDARDSMGMTPLHLAARGDAGASVVEALVRAGANVDARALGGVTPLHVAAWHGASAELVGALVSAGANVDARELQGGTPLMMAAGHSGSVETLLALVEAGAELDLADANGWTALMLAADANANPAVVQALLDLGANARLRDADGLSALDLAYDNPALLWTDAFWALNDASY